MGIKMHERWRHLPRMGFNNRFDCLAFFNMQFNTVHRHTQQLKEILWKPLGHFRRKWDFLTPPYCHISLNAISSTIWESSDICHKNRIVNHQCPTNFFEELLSFSTSTHMQFLFKMAILTLNELPPSFCNFNLFLFTASLHQGWIKLDQLIKILLTYLYFIT